MQFTDFEPDDDLKKVMIIVAMDSGKILGKLTRIAIEENNGSLSGISFRKKFSNDELFLKIERVNRIGTDVIFIDNEMLPDRLDGAETLPGRDLFDFQGTWIYASNGEAIGVLTDIGFSQADWTISKMYLLGDKMFDVSSKNMQIRQDAITLQTPVAVKSITESPQSKGLLAGLFGTESVTRANVILQRTLRSKINS